MLRKVQRALALRLSLRQVNARPKVLFFFFLKRLFHSLLVTSVPFCGSAAEVATGSGKTDGQSLGWTSRSSNGCGALSFGSHVSNLQSTDNFYLASGPTSWWTFWWVCVLCQICKNEQRNFSGALLLRCSDEYSDRDS